MYIRVRVKTNAKRENVKKILDDLFEIEVKEKPKMNLANLRVVALMARELGIPTTKLRIIAGHHHSSKIIAFSPT